MAVYWRLLNTSERSQLINAFDYDMKILRNAVNKLVNMYLDKVYCKQSSSLEGF